MKKEELLKIKEELIKLKNERDEILKLEGEIKVLEQNETVKKYLDLLDLYDESLSGRKKNFNKKTDDDLLKIVINNNDITPREDIYVYIGTYKYSDEIDIVHGPSDIPVSRNAKDANYVIYYNLESKYYDSVEIPYKKYLEFESKHTIIIPENIVSRKKYFYDLQKQYFDLLINESEEKANEMINKLVRKK